MFTRIPSGDEWARLIRYASWMRVLSPPHASIIPDNIFQQLSLATSGGLVCPRLQRLAWTSSCGWEHIQRFLSPRLVSISFRRLRIHQPVNPGSKFASIIPLLPTAHLEELRIDIISPSIHSVLSETVRQLKTCFKRISVHSTLSDAAWEHLASLPKLGSLRVYDTPSTKISESIPHQLTFPTLERMKIRVDSVRQRWPLLFSLLKSSPLQEIIIETDRETRIHDDVPSQVTFAVLEAELQRTVRTLSFTGFDPAHLSFLPHLQPFRSLKELAYVTRCPWSDLCVFPLRDSAIEWLASTLPHLVSLQLGHICRRNPPNTTIKSLISLSTHCLSLETLYLPCDLTNISEAAKMESGEIDPRLGTRNSCTLRTFGFHWVVMPPQENIEAAGIVASALRHLFPRSQPIG